MENPSSGCLTLAFFTLPIYYPTSQIELVRLSLPLTDLSFPPCRALATHGGKDKVPWVLVHHNLNELDSSKAWAVPPLRNMQAIARLCSILGKSFYYEGFIKVQNQGYLLCSSWADPNTLLFGTHS